MSKHMAEQHYPECERHRDGSPDCCICVRLEEHGYEFIAKVRADEREQLAHAEAVAAQLVGVVCVQERHAGWMRQCWRAVTRERDAARAKVDALRHALGEAIRQRDAAIGLAAKHSAEVDRMVGELSSIRMEHEAALRRALGGLDAGQGVEP